MSGFFQQQRVMATLVIVTATSILHKIAMCITLNVVFAAWYLRFGVEGLEFI